MNGKPRSFPRAVVSLAVVRQDWHAGPSVVQERRTGQVRQCCAVPEGETRLYSPSC